MHVRETWRAYFVAGAFCLTRQPWTMANSCSEALGFVTENREQFVSIMQKALARAQVQGKLDKQADPAELANYLFVCYNGLQVVVQTNIEREALVKVVVRSVEGLPWRKA